MWLNGTAPRRFYFYYMFALEWDKSLLPPPPQPHHHEEQDAPPGAANGRATQPQVYDQKSVNLTADKPVRPNLRPRAYPVHVRERERQADCATTRQASACQLTTLRAPSCLAPAWYPEQRMEHVGSWRARELCWCSLVPCATPSRKQMRSSF